MNGADVLYRRPFGGASVTASGDSGTIDTSLIRAGRLDYTVGALVGGTTPTLTISLQLLGGDGVWYTAWTGTPVAAAGGNSGTGVNFAEDSATPVIFTLAARLVWTFGGAVNATSIPFSVSFVGRS